MFYRATRQTKHVFVKFLRRLFDLVERGDIKLVDGTRTIKFSKKPVVMETDSWDDEKRPVVLIGATVGPMQWLSINDIVSVLEVSPDKAKIITGATMDLEMSITCLADSKEERDDLADIVAMHLSFDEMRRYFLRQGGLIQVIGKPQFRGEATLDSPTTDLKLYQTDLSLNVQTRWFEEGEELDTLSTVEVTDLELEAKAPEGALRVVTPIDMTVDP